MECLKDIFPFIESIFTSVAILVGGWWTWNLYLRQRLHYPKATVTLHMYDTCLPRGKRLIHVTLKIVNAGNVILKPTSAELRLRQVVPLDDTLKDLLDSVSKGYDPVLPEKQEIEWPMIAGRTWDFPAGKFEIEPGEDDSLHADFVIDARIKVIQLYSFIKNPKKETIRTRLYRCLQGSDKQPSFGWTATQMHELTPNQKGKNMPKSSDEKRKPLNEQQEQKRIQQPQQKQQQPKQQPPVKKQPRNSGKGETQFTW